MAKTISDDISAFEKDGVVCLRSVLTPGEIDKLRMAVSAQLSEYGKSVSGYDFESIATQVWDNEKSIDTKSAARFDFSNTKERIQADKNARPLREPASGSAGGMFFYDAAGWRLYSEVREVAFNSALPEMMAGLMKSERVNFWEDTTFVKAPGTRQRTVFHQDLAYFQISGEQCVIVWIALDPADQSNGGMQYVRGSHLDETVYSPNVLFAQTPAIGAVDCRLPDIEGEIDQYDLISFEVEPGDVIVHHVRTIHGSGGNMSKRNRRAVSFRYCGDDIRYNDRPGAIEQLYVTHNLKTGDPLDSPDYPLVWPRTEGGNLVELYGSASAKAQSGRNG